MRFEIQGVTQGPGLDKFMSDWIDYTIQENGMIVGDKRISEAQLLMINLFCGRDAGYSNMEGVTISTYNDAQAELEALFRARGRALATLFTSTQG